MPALRELGRKMANMAAKIKARNAEPHCLTTEAEATDELVSMDSRAHRFPSIQPPKPTLLQYVSGKWLDADSIADTSSTITCARIEASAQRESSSLQAIGDPSYQRRPEYNDAVQYIYSLPDSRSESSLYYLQGGRPTSPKERKILHGQGHRYCCGNPLAEPVAGNVFPVTETVHPDWRVHALGRKYAGHWSLQDLSERHLTERLLYNAKIRTPDEHLHGSQKAAAQDLEAIHMENYALKFSSSQADDHATQLQENVGTLRKSIAQIEEDIDIMRLELDAHGQGHTTVQVTAGVHSGAR